MKVTDKMSRAISQIEKMYNTINTDIFQGELPIPIITVQSKPGSMGHSTVAKIWRKPGKEQTYELNIAAEVLDYPIEETLDTIIHEMVHLYCREHDIKECSRNGVYHNKKFKEEAEKRGLTCYHTDKYGWNTKPGDNLIEYAMEKGWSEIRISRGYGFKIGGMPGSKGAKEGGAKPGEKKTSSTRKYICPCCKQSVRATKTVNILCGECNETMIVA